MRSLPDTTTTTGRKLVAQKTVKTTLARMVCPLDHAFKIPTVRLLGTAGTAGTAPTAAVAVDTPHCGHGAVVCTCGGCGRPVPALSLRRFPVGPEYTVMLACGRCVGEEEPPKNSAAPYIKR